LVAEGPAELSPAAVVELVHVGHRSSSKRRGLDPLRQQGPERHEVGVDARMRLYVGMVGTEERPGALGRQLFHDVDVAAAGVHPPPDGPFGILVAEPVAHRQKYRRRGIVLAGDQLERAALVG
jgi:hypothetical protein